MAKQDLRSPGLLALNHQVLGLDWCPPVLDLETKLRLDCSSAPHHTFVRDVGKLRTSSSYARLKTYIMTGRWTPLRRIKWKQLFINS